jgi:hypothetical protein
LKKKIEKWKPEIEKAWVPWISIGFGQTLYACYVPNNAFPVGLVWGQGTNHGKYSSFEVAGLFVPAWVRRHGVRTRINEELLKHYELITTVGGSKDGGLKFLKATGYRYTKNTGLWYLRRPRRKVK